MTTMACQGLKLFLRRVWRPLLFYIYAKAAARCLSLSPAAGEQASTPITAIFLKLALADPAKINRSGLFALVCMEYLWQKIRPWRVTTALSVGVVKW